MAIRDRIIGAARAATALAGEALTGLSASPLFKAEAKEDRDQVGESEVDEGSDRTPGGDQEDTAGSAPVPTDKAKDDPKSLFWDPFAVIEQLGYKDKPSPITYGTLKHMVWRVPIVHAVVQLRVNQVASASVKVVDRHQFGWRIRMRDSRAKPTKQDKKWIEECEPLIMRTGLTDNPRGRDDFEKFLRKSVFDSLVYDQMAWEIVPNRKGQPAEWYAVDSSTIRLADTSTTTHNEDLDKTVRYVQIYDGMVISEYTQEEMCFAVRNPRSDLKLYGYGTSELEMLVPAITSLLYAWEYNSKFFTQGSAAKGIVNFKGAIPEKQLKAFRRHWYQMLSGVENAWRTPITNAEELQWISMQTTNKDMEFNAWMDFLIKVVCSMYQMDPIEVNFKYGNTGQKGGMNEANNKEKILESRERGLRPILRFIAQNINKHIIHPMNENFEFEFVGLDAKTKDEIADLNMKRVKTTMTIDELRAEDDLDPLPDGQGAVILDPTFLQFMNAKKQEEQQAKMAEQGINPMMGGMPGQPGAPGAPPFGQKPGGQTFGEPDFDKLLADEDKSDKKMGMGAKQGAAPLVKPAIPGAAAKAGVPQKPAKPAKPSPFAKSMRPNKKLIVDVRF
jgi:HK97 family phage portal protein